MDCDGFKPWEQLREADERDGSQVQLVSNDDGGSADWLCLFISIEAKVQATSFRTEMIVFRGFQSFQNNQCTD